MFSFNKNGKNKAKIPALTRIYAIGDIHGCYGLMQKMHGIIKQDAESAGDNFRKIIIYLGDFIDRGPDSKRIIDSFISENIEGFERIFIKGNHENAMLDFLEDSSIGDMWVIWGGNATMESYGVDIRDTNGKRYDKEALQKAFRKAVPELHINFLKNLPVKHVEGDYVFVHAGVQPNVELSAQTDYDMMMIRGEFINSQEPLPGKVVVFGHTIFEEAFYKDGKIGLDTGAYSTGKLTAVVLEDDQFRFLTTK